MSLRVRWASLAVAAAPVVGAAVAACHGGSSSGGQVEPPAIGFSAECEGLGLPKSDCDRWSHMALPPALPAAKGNRFADDENAAKLGFALFFDLGSLTSSTEKTERCSDCHTPERDFANNVVMPTGAGLVQRNALSLVNAARTYPHFWDGRADSLWSQSLLTIENVDEMLGTRLGVAHAVARSYREAYELVFGALPDFSDAVRFPAQGKPGMPEWEAMTKADRDAVTQVYVNVGKSFEAYLRKIAAGRSAVDRFIVGESAALSTRAKLGLRLFTLNGCLDCHSGPNLSDGLYHGLDLPLPTYPPFRAKSGADRGRAQGLEFLQASEFNSLSPYFDRPAGETPRMEEELVPMPDGMFLTPSLRNVGDTAPYGHNGVFATLDAVVRFHLAGGGPSGHELTAHTLSEDEVGALVEFLQSLRGDTAPLPWSFWPKIGGDAGADGYPDSD